jgi:hypothetical protein
VPDDILPPPPRLPDGVGGHDDDEEPDEDSRGRKTFISMLAKVKRWWKLATTIGTILATVGGIGAGIWKIAFEISDLHDTIQDNKEQVASLKDAYEGEKNTRTTQMENLVKALQTLRERDQEVIINLRIAVAALQAAQGVRQGRVGYSGVEAMGGSGDAAIGISEAPTTLRGRREQAEWAESDAHDALIRAAQAQNDDDPLSGLLF